MKMAATARIGNMNSEVAAPSGRSPERMPLGAATSLFMFPILAIAAIFILRGVRKRGREIG